uniref:Peptidase M12B domain-containing protein n=1 Tax=Anopheles farauti TaxID=69004 RepID=A0A182Q5U7_9DIPT
MAPPAASNRLPNGEPLDRSTTNQHNRHSRQRRNAEYSPSEPSNNEYTIEVLVVVDNKMQRYHSQALKSYVLTLMSIVSSVYADASIGNSIKIAVSHIMYIHHDLDAQTNAVEKGLEGVSASEMLQDFCHFKQRSNFQHDVALLLTREQICRNPEENNCDTLGLAELGTICRESACAIVQDNGLSAAFTIAHELGHVLGMPHDDDRRCQPYRGKPSGNNRIMSRTIDHNTHPWQWSNCSRQIITEFLEKNPDNCMLNQPAKDLIAPNEMDTKLAGEKFTNNEQCELVFGDGSKICSYMPVCSRLWCSWGDEMAGCKTQHMPWADGTECNEGHWCQKGHCVPIDRSALKPQNGGWSEWGPYGVCSRSCGAGIKTRTRECDSPNPKNGGKFCTGTRIEYATCNTQPCPDTHINFREQQCRERNGQNFNLQGLDSNVKWVPKYGTPLADQCKLFCRVQDTSNYFMLSEKVIDGTPCTFPEDSFDMCVNGQCRKAGCDYVLNSDAKLDQCGKCNGDNSTCAPVQNRLKYGKHSGLHESPKEFNIPEGATNINILNVGYVRELNFLMLTSGTEIIFNDPSHPTPYTNRQRLFAGVRLEYTAHGNQERITSNFGRPLKEKITVRIVHRAHSDKHTNSEVRYSYLIPKLPSGATLSNAIHTKREHEPYHQHHHQHHHHQHHRHAHHPPSTVQSVQPAPVPSAGASYRWEMSAWLKCDQQCRKRRTAICYNIDTKQEVSPDNCNQSVKPQDDYSTCNQECKFSWKTHESCSSSCGLGIKTFKNVCIRTNLELNTQEDVDPAQCSALPTPLNSRVEVCEGPCKNATVQYAPWNKCSCTDGTKNRTAMCLSEPNGFKIEDHYCKERREEVLPCSEDELKECAEWVTGEPTPCSVTCGEGQRAYAVQCMIKNVTVNAALCGTRPVTVIMNCTMPPCEPKNDVQPKESMKGVNYLPNTDPIPDPIGWWRYSGHPNCSADSKGGFKRIPSCISKRTGQSLDDRYCPQPKPATQINSRSCPSWVFGQWTKCNDECKRSRQVVCQDHRNRDSDQCSPDLKPPAVESCCSFKWRYTCSGSCDAEGRRTPQPVCKRLYPKSADNPQPFKTGVTVDNKYCAKAKYPSLSKLRKKCSKPCPFRWKTMPWSKCSVGCGSGWTVRNVTCTDGRSISPKACNMTLKPPNTKICEAFTDCRWRVVKSNRCNCKGKQNRTVKCYDEMLNVESNRCPENTRPRKQIKCQPPPHCHKRHHHHAIVYKSCADAQRKHRSDGEYTMAVNGTSVRIYCHGMAGRDPAEYLTLPAGPTENYAIYINRRAADANKCQISRRDWADESISYGATHYRKIRIHLPTLRVITNDFLFTNSSGKKQAFGSAGDCYSNTAKCPQGDFAINLEGTPFRIRSRTKWETTGVNAVLKFLVTLQPPYKKVRALCGGYCGSCSVSHATHLYLELG